MPLITTPEQLQPFLPAPYANSLQSLPDFTAAEARHLLPIIGQELYDALHGQNLSTNMNDLLKKCRAVIAPFGYLDHIPFLQTMLSDQGLIAIEADNTRKSFKWEYNEAREALEARGYGNQELLISYLQTKKSSFPDWANSPYNEPGFAIIRNGMELAPALPVFQPHRTFMCLKPVFLEVGLLNIASALGGEYYDDLSSRILSDELHSIEKGFLPMLRMACAKFAMANAAETQNVKFIPGAGFTIADSVKDSPLEGRKNASADDRKILIDSLRTGAAALMDGIIKTLDEKASSILFPLYFNSSKYTNPHESSKNLRSGRSGMFCAS